MVHVSIPPVEGRRRVKPDELEGAAQGPFLFGSHVRRELVLADLIREALQENSRLSHPPELRLLQMPRALGPLEAEVMEVVWRNGEACVRAVHRVLSTRREIAYTTVLTVLRNLNRKGLLVRRQGETGYIYYPRFSRQEYIQARVGEIIDLLLDNLPAPTLTHLLKRIEREKG